MNIIYLGRNLLKNNVDINYGGMIRKYYSQVVLSRNANLMFLEKYLDMLILRNNIIDKSTFLWIHYPLQRKLSFAAIVLSFFFTNKIVLTVHDLPILQQKDLTGTRYPPFKLFTIKLIENILFRKAKYIILAAPGLKRFIPKKEEQTFIIMPPGISEKEQINAIKPKNHINKKKVALYFGSMKRSDSIVQLTKLFSHVELWELHLVGPLDDEQLYFSENIKYLGQTSHQLLSDIIYSSDVILIPYPKKEYFNLCMPIKLGYSLISCKPIIATKLDGIKEYVQYVDLNENVIYIDDWNEKNLIHALNETLNSKIDKINTLNKMSLMSWDKRLEELIKIICEEKEYEDIKWL